MTYGVWDEVRRLERELSLARTSAERGPVLEKLAEARRRLREHRAHLSTLRRVDLRDESTGNRLPGFSVHEPLEPRGRRPRAEEGGGSPRVQPQGPPRVAVSGVSRCQKAGFGAPDGR